MIQAIGAIYYNHDPEYIRILWELRKLGIPATGNKAIDKSRLAQAKKELEENFELKDFIKQDANPERAEMEEKRTGAVALGEINKILLGL